MNEKCPFLKLCEKKVDFETFMATCQSHSYLSCEEYERIKKTHMKPKEWIGLLGVVRKWNEK